MRATLVRTIALPTAVIATGLVSATATAQTAPPPICGRAWTQVATPSPGTIYSVLLDVAAIGTEEAWAVGFRAYIGSDGMFANSPIIEQWDGTEWTVAYRPRLQGQLAGVYAVSADDIWAVGHTGLESVDFQPLIMHWDGTKWRKIDSPRVDLGYLTADWRHQPGRPLGGRHARRDVRDDHRALGRRRRGRWSRIRPRPVTTWRSVDWPPVRRTTSRSWARTSTTARTSRSACTGTARSGGAPIR